MHQACDCDKAVHDIVWCLGGIVFLFVVEKNVVLLFCVGVTKGRIWKLGKSCLVFVSVVQSEISVFIVVIGS